MTPALLHALDARTGRTWHADDDGAHTTGWIWRLERALDFDVLYLLTHDAQNIAAIPVDPDPWTTADAIADAIAAHTARITTTTTEETAT